MVVAKKALFIFLILCSS